MNQDVTFWAYVVIWGVNIIYCVGLFPQIKLNYDLKSTKGLSDLMIVGYTIAYLSYVLYVFCLNLPLGYKVLVPAALATSTIILLQRFYYHGINHTPLFFYAITMVSIITVITIPFAWFYPNRTGHISGWVSVIAWSVYLLPQFLRIYQKKSTQGFSFIFITIMALGMFIELVSALILNLPPQTIYTNMRGLIFYFIFCIQFYLYPSRFNREVHNLR